MTERTNAKPGSETPTSGSESSTSSLSFSIASQMPIRALTVRLNSWRTRRLYATVCFSVFVGRETESYRFPEKEQRTMLFAVERFNAVAGVVVLPEIVFLLSIGKGGIVLPRRGGLGGINLALQNVDCTRNDEREASETTATTATRSKACTFVHSVGHDIESFGFEDRGHYGKS